MNIVKYDQIRLRNNSTATQSMVFSRLLIFVFIQQGIQMIQVELFHR